MENNNDSIDFLLYSSQEGGGVKAAVLIEGETIWTSQKNMSKIFGVEENTITYHIKEVYKTAELQAF
jgi:hypothetical protein